MQNQYENKTVTIIGLGKTGLSCVDFFADKNAKVQVIDTRKKPAGVEQLSKEIPLHTGGLNLEWLLNSVRQARQLLPSLVQMVRVRSQH